LNLFSLTHTIGKKIIHFENIDSTNTYALNLIAKSNPIEGTAISTDFQDAGKGQRNNIWQSEAKLNLLFSVILYPSFLNSRQQFFLSMFTANAICRVLKNYLPADKLRVKWPNDIYFENRKLGGMLIQNNLKGEKIESSVIGIGINVNQTHFPEKLPNPSSIAIESGKKQDTEELLKLVLLEMDQDYAELQKAYFKKIKNQFEDNLYKIGQSYILNSGGNSYEGMILGVENDGRIIMNINGVVRKIMH
jgi:BirA family biotin operon repressor/biotin-[acetyl-CoA-carboxylase] ligase